MHEQENPAPAEASEKQPNAPVAVPEAREMLRISGAGVILAEPGQMLSLDVTPRPKCSVSIRKPNGTRPIGLVCATCRTQVDGFGPLECK